MFMKDTLLVVVLLWIRYIVYKDFLGGCLGWDAERFGMGISIPFFVFRLTFCLFRGCV
jgi:hypothetical protein